MRKTTQALRARTSLMARARSTISTTTAVAALLLPQVAHAQESGVPPAGKEPSKRALGERGEVVLDLFGGQSGLGGYNTFVLFAGPVSVTSSSSERVDESGARSSHESTGVGLAPSVDVFVLEGLSLGGRATAAWLSSEVRTTPPPGVGALGGLQGDSHGHTIGVAPRIGYALALSETWAIWPRLSGGVDVTRQQFEGLGRTVSRTFSGAIDVGVVLRLGRHALFDFGPVVAYRSTHTDGQLGAVSVGFPSPAGIGSSERSSSLGGGMRASLRVVF